MRNGHLGELGVGRASVDLGSWGVGARNGRPGEWGFTRCSKRVHAFILLKSKLWYHPASRACLVHGEVGGSACG